MCEMLFIIALHHMDIFKGLILVLSLLDDLVDSFSFIFICAYGRAICFVARSISFVTGWGGITWGMLCMLVSVRQDLFYEVGLFPFGAEKDYDGDID